MCTSEDTLRDLEEAYNTLPTPDNLNNVKLQTREVSELHLKKAKQRLLFCKTRIYEHWQKAGKMLAYLTHLDEKPLMVVSLNEPDG